MWLSLATLARGACSITELSGYLDTAERSLTDVDLAGFRAAATAASATVACLSAPVDRPLAARIHRIAGLKAFFNKDEPRAESAFAAARRLDPTYSFPETLLPAGHPARKAWATLDPVPAETVVAAPPRQGELVFDGVVTRARPAAIPTVAQLVVSTHAVTGAYLWPGDPLFPYEIEPVAAAVPSVPAPTVAAASAPKPQPRPQPKAQPKSPPKSKPSPAPAPSAATKKSPGKGPNAVLTVASVASFVGAGAAYYVAYDAHTAYYDDDTPEAFYDSLRERTNVAYATSVGAGVLGAGLGVTAFAAGRW